MLETLDGGGGLTAWMAQGPPGATAGAHFNADFDRPALSAPLSPPPAPCFLPGGFERFVEVVEHGMGSAVAIDEAEASRLAYRSGPGLGLGIRQHGIPSTGHEILAMFGILDGVLQHFFGSWWSTGWIRAAGATAPRWMKRPGIL